eukprot:TRINITY_DN63_c0_g1_i7.p1 TRINITY_DN63_c0_g1~~TRINITY_DN63_c0_g1_i7.p1  ORF type:complete len:1412 (+),score=436.89 TRINITY_DN63_c0_g1_i7:1704-5939(+)
MRRVARRRRVTRRRKRRRHIRRRKNNRAANRRRRALLANVQCRSTGDPHYTAFSRKHFNIYGKQGDLTLFALPGFSVVTTLRYGAKWGNRGLNAAVKINYRGKNLVYNQHGKYAGPRAYRLTTKRGRGSRRLYFNVAGKRVTVNMGYVRVGRRNKLHAAGYYNVYITTQRRWANMSTGVCNRGNKKAIRGRSRYWLTLANRLLRKLPFRRRRRIARRCRSRSNVAFYNCVRDTIKKLGRVARRVRRARRRRAIRWDRIAASWLRRVKNAADRRVIARKCSKRYQRVPVVRLGKKQAGKQLACRSTGDPHYRSFHGRSFNIYSFQGSKTLFQYRNVRIVTNIKYGAKWGKRGLNSGVYVQINGRRVASYNDLCRSSGSRKYAMKKNRANYWLRANDGQKIRLYLTCNRVSNSGKRHFSRAYYNVYVYARALASLSGSGICTSGAGNRVNAAVWTVRANALKKKLPAIVLNRVNRICRRVKTKARYYNCVYDVARGFSKIAARRIRHRRSRRRRYHVLAIKILRSIKNKRARRRIALLCKKRYGRHALRFYRCVSKHKRGRRVRRRRRRRVIRRRRRIRRQFVRKLPARYSGRQVTCRSTGDPHYRSFAGRAFNIYGVQGRRTLFQYKNVKLVTNIKYGSKWGKRGLNSQVELYMSNRRVATYTDLCKYAGAKNFAMKRNRANYWVRARDGQRVRFYMTCHRVSNKGKSHFSRAYYNVYVYARQLTALNSSGICTSGRGHRANSAIWARRTAVILRKLNAAQRRRANHICRRQKLRARKYNCVFDVAQGMARAAARHIARRRARQRKYLARANKILRRVRNARARANIQRACYRRYRKHATRYLGCVVRKYNAWKRAAVSGKLRKRVTCVSSGDPHYRAFNGRRFDIYGKTGRMTLFKYGNLKVDTLVSYGKRWRNRGLNTGVQIFLGRKLIGSYDTNGRFGGKSFARMVRRGKRGAKTLALKVRGHVVHVYIRYQYLGYGGIRGYYNVTLRSNQYVSVQSSGICARGGSGHLGNSIYWLQQANRLLAKIKNKARRFKIVRACRRQKPRARFFNCVNDAYVGFLRLAAAHARRRRLAYIRNLKLATYWFNKITVARQRIRATSYCRRRYSRNGRLHAKRYMMCARAHARRFTRGLRLHLLKRLSQRRYANCVRASVRRYLHGKRLLYILRRRCVTKFVMVNKGWIKIRRGKNVRAMQRWVRTSRVTITRHCARFRGLRTRYLRIISRWRLYFLRLIRRRRLVKYSTYRPTRICQRHNHIQYKNLRTYEETKVLQTGDMALNTRCGSVRKYVRFAFRASRYIWNKLAKQERAIGCQSCWSGKKPTGLRKWKCLAQLAGGLVYSCAGTHALYRYADFAYKRLAWFVKKNGAAIGAGNGMKVLRYLKRAVHRFKYQRHSLRRLLATMRCSFCAQKV